MKAAASESATLKSAEPGMHSAKALRKAGAIIASRQSDR
jgi:hypothetical protein